MEEVRPDSKQVFDHRFNEFVPDPAAAAQHLQPGTIVDGRYEIKSLIGQGGMGCVYLVEQVFLHKQYALKTLNPGHMSEVSWRRFQKEAHTTSALDHPSLIKVYDFGMINDSQPYFVMDYVTGETLSHYLETKGPLPQTDALAIFTQLSNAIAHAHTKGVIHRDIKPSNIMLTKGGTQYQVCLVDFGVAKLVSAIDQETNNLTRTGEVFGTPYYMSPEQCLGTALDHRADIYSLGAVIYQTLTGAPPFIGDSALSIMMQHQNTTPASLKEASLGKIFPEAVERIVQKMLKKNPAERYQNLTDVAVDLEAAKTGQYVVSSSSETMTQKKSHFKLIFSICSGLCAFIGVAALSFVIGRSTAPLKSTYNVLPVHVSPNQEQLATANKNSANIVPDISNTHFFSTFTDTSKRTFHFGKTEEESPGIMIFPNSVDCMTAQVTPEGRKKVYAVGDVTINNFQPFLLLVSDNLDDHPEYLSRFRPDEVSGLSVTSAIGNVFRDESLQYCGHLKSLKSARVESSKLFTDKVLTYLDELPNLVELSVSKTAVTGAGVAKMQNLKKFKALDVSSLAKIDGADVLPALSGSKAIRDLNVRLSGVDDRHVAQLNTLDNLRSLDTSSSFLTDRGLASLVSLKHLEDLNIFDCDKLTVNCFSSLAKMPALKTVTIGATKVPNQFTGKVDELRKILKGKVDVKE